MSSGRNRRCKADNENKVESEKLELLSEVNESPNTMHDCLSQQIVVSGFFINESLGGIKMIGLFSAGLGLLAVMEELGKQRNHPQGNIASQRKRVGFRKKTSRVYDFDDEDDFGDDLSDYNLDDNLGRATRSKLAARKKRIRANIRGKRVKRRGNVGKRRGEIATRRSEIATRRSEGKEKRAANVSARRKKIAERQRAKRVIIDDDSDE